MATCANFSFGEWLSSPPKDEEVVISGIAGRFPECNNVQELSANLLNKKDMVTANDRRWQIHHPEIPKRSGTIPNIEKFDAGFFGIHHRQADYMDPVVKKLLEVTAEAVMDAGTHPSELEGSKTGVFIGYSWSDVATEYLRKIEDPQKYGMTGYLKSMVAQRISYFLKLRGPSYVLDTACSSSLIALDHAFRAIRTGRCDQALVGGAHLTIHPAVTLQFFRVGVLGPDGSCKVFDQNANGYVRSEAVSCIFLQKAKTSKRIYAKIIHTKSNSDGFKDDGLLFPSSSLQGQLLKEMYDECGVKPSELSYFEVHGTATKVGDLQEIQAIDEVIGKHRNKPLFIGSVKSNIGHSEPASGMSSIIKVLLAMETGTIAPNLHFETPKQGMDAIFEGRLVPVTELVSMDKEAVVGVSNFGFGGSNCHVVLRRFVKNKIIELDDVPKLICVSGRTQEAVRTILDEIIRRPNDNEWMAMVQSVFAKPFSNHLFRGFVILTRSKLPVISIEPYVENRQKLPFYINFGKFEESYKTLEQYFMQFPVFKKLHLEFNNHFVANITGTAKRNDRFDNELLEGAAVQSCLMSVLKELDLTPIATWDNSVDDVFQRTFKANGKNFKNVARASNLTLDLSDKNKSLREDPSIFLRFIGKVYQQGYNPQVQNLYRKIEYPVSPGTPHISPLVKWNYDRSWVMEKFYTLKGVVKEEFKIDLNEEEFKYITGHVIDGRNLFPATGYLFLVWQILAGKKLLQTKNFPIIFENCKFVRATTLTKNEIVFTISVQEKSGHFEIMANDMVAVTGRISRPENIEEHEIGILPPTFTEENPAHLLDEDEIYKELNLRGYNYSGLFNGLSKCNIQATEGLVKWTDNWVTFMDTMLQLKIFQMDTRLLYVPTAIKKLVIDPAKQLEAVQTDENLLPVVADRNYNVIKSAGIEIHGLEASPISKRPLPDPVLEKYEFVPNKAALDLAESVRVNTQIILENSLEDDVKAVEMIDDFTEGKNETIMSLMYSALENVPIVRPDLTISSQKSMEEIPGIKIEPVDLGKTNNLLLIVATKVFQRPGLLDQIVASLGDKGFGLSREDKDFAPDESLGSITVLTVHTLENEKLILFKKSQTTNVSIEISFEDLDWISQTQKAVSSGSDVILYSQNQPSSGILGFINCIRREPGGSKVRCFFLMGEVPKFDAPNPFYKTQIDKNLAINVYKHSEWGTYRHLLLDELADIPKESCFVSVTSRGDLSSLRWIEGHLPQNGQYVIHNHYSAVNFKDIMTASGRVAAITHRMNQDRCEGFEYSGKDSKGNRVMGMVPNGGLANLIAADRNLCWSIPKEWSLEDGATVPVVYGTVIYALLMRTNLKPGTSILIHSAAGGIGIAALNVALHHRCDIFVTVGTQEKRDYLRTHFPQIADSHIGNSRDTSFEEMIKKVTKGRGVDIVLNSLAEDKLIASVRCLARGGQFMEIGKFDLANDNTFNLLLLEKEASYHGVMLDTIMEETADIKLQLKSKVSEGMKRGYVKPLPRTVFGHDEVEAAFRYMTTGKHIGKVLLKIGDGDVSTEPTQKLISARPRFYCDPDKSYLILGGLGGFGLELADWLVLRGAKKLVLSSRSGVQNGYQTQRIKTWQTYGVSVRTSTTNINTKQGCLELIRDASAFGPLDAIFNLAVVLEDALFEDQTQEKFNTAFTPKAYATKYLDQISRDLCEHLRHFVVFSSVSCGRGNAGQTNYGMANSIMERICEKRKQDGYPALAIQWGAVGDVGLVAKMQKDNKELVIGGTLQQKISSCLKVMDRFLNQDSPVVASMVVAEKRDKNSGGTPLEAVAKIIGIKNLKTVSYQATLAELGMDSIMGTEIIQMLEKDFGIFVTAKEVRTITLSKLMELESEKSGDIKEKKDVQTANLLLQHMPSSEIMDVPTVVLKNCAQEGAPEIFVLPGVEGIFTLLEPAIAKLDANVFGIQYNYENVGDDVETIAQKILPHLEKHLSKTKTFCLMAHSFGVLVALELANLLENRNYRGKIAAIDGSPRYSVEALNRQAPTGTEQEFETMIMFNILAHFLPVNVLGRMKEQLHKCNSFNERLNLASALMKSEMGEKQQLSEETSMMVLKRFKSVRNYNYTKEKVQSPVKLYKCEFSLVGNMESDYGLSELCEQPVEVMTVEGNHVTMLQQSDLVEDMRNFFKLSV